MPSCHKTDALKWNCARICMLPPARQMDAQKGHIDTVGVLACRCMLITMSAASLSSRMCMAKCNASDVYAML